MQVGPLLPGRIPGSMLADRLVRSLHDSQRNLTRLQEQVSSGQKFFLPSDSPHAAVRTIGLQKLAERKSQMLVNIQTDRSLLSASESALSTVSDALNRARQISSAGIGDSSTAEEKAAMAIEVRGLVQQLVNVGNTQFRGRYLFGGSNTGQAPFSLTTANAVHYAGDTLQLESFVDLNLRLANNVDGHTAFGALTSPITRDVNPALSLNSSLTDLHGGEGITLSSIQIDLSNGSQSVQVDLSSAKTISDIKALIENAVSPGTLTVSINAARNGLELTPSSGTVTVSEVTGGITASDLGIIGTGAAITGADLDPLLSLTTDLADLNGGAGIGTTAGKGLRIVNGSTTQVVDISAAVTVEDLLNALRREDLQLSAEINTAGNGFAISSRLSGVSFSIGENNANGDVTGNNATALGIRTFTATTLLADLNYERGVPVDTGLLLTIHRHDGTSVDVDLAGSITVQDVLDKITASAAGLTAALNNVGNGISITDSSVGTDNLRVDTNELAITLGLSGQQVASGQSLVGTEINPQEVHGTMNVLIRLQRALEAGDNVELTRVNALVASELDRLNQARGSLGSALKVLDEVDNRLQEEQIATQESLSLEFDADLTEVITQLVAQQTAFQATLQSSAETMRISLLDYI